MFIHTSKRLIINFIEDVIKIKIIDYIAENLDVPEVTANISEVSVIGASVVRINNFGSICEYSEDKIALSLPDGNICISGDNLTINMITDNFLQISGRLYNISFEEGAD